MIWIFTRLFSKLRGIESMTDSVRKIGFEKILLKNQLNFHIFFGD